MSDKYIKKVESNGSINISEDVFVSIVVNAISNVDGVAGLANTAGAELAELVGLKTIPKGVKVSFEDGKVIVDSIITVLYGRSILKVAKDVQDAVANSIEAGTGISDPVVNVHVSGVTFDRNI